MIKIADLLDCHLSTPVEDAVTTVLRKKPSQEPVLRNLFQQHGAALIQNINLEQCVRRTHFNEDQFVRFYPYLPHLIDLSIEIMDGIRADPDSPKLSGGANYTLARQCFEMLVSDRTRLAHQPVGALVSIDRIYELLEGSIPPDKQHQVNVLGERGKDKRYPGLAARVAKAICLMQFAQTNLPRTTKNIAALLVQTITEQPPVMAVAAILDGMKKAQLVREPEDGWRLYEFDFEELRKAADALETLKNDMGAVNPRPPGWHNELIQTVKRLQVGALAWYTRPLRAFGASAGRSIQEIVGVLDRLVDLPLDVAVLQKRLAAAEKQIDLLRQQAKGLPHEFPHYLDTSAVKERTTYIVGLFGTGRQYVGELMRQNIGERAKYFRDGIRLHSGPTPMIYTGHCTLKYVSRAQHLPATTSRILEAVRAGCADLIFIYRHPLDSLLTNWVWWRTYIREHKRCIAGISHVYKNTDDLCADLENNVAEFKTFAEGDPAFFADADQGPRFLSFAEFVEETELYLQSAATLTLRMEDFAIDPLKEFSKILNVMSIAPDVNELSVAPPRSKPYGHLVVKDKVPEFAKFMDGLNAETKRRIEKLGYHC